MDQINALTEFVRADAKVQEIRMELAAAERMKNSAARLLTDAWFEGKDDVLSESNIVQFGTSFYEVIIDIEGDSAHTIRYLSDNAIIIIR